MPNTSPAYDRSLDEAVSRVLADDPALSGEHIHVALDRGVVTLTGGVDSLLAKRRAEALLEAVRGVRAIVNRIEVQPRIVPSDTTIAEHVREALRFDSAIDASAMRVIVAQGRVILRGSADSVAEIQLARRAAESVAGVRHVTVELALRATVVRSDPAIEAEVKALLAADTWIDHGLIRVAVDDGIVTLAGTVGSVSERNRAVSKAWVRGARGVRLRGLEVEPWANKAELRATPDVRLPPDEIARSVEVALYYDPRVSSERIDVSVEGPRVVLTGSAEDLRAKRAAVQDAASTVGVQEVDDRIRVEPAPSADEEIAARLRQAIESHPFLTDDAVEVGVHEGTALLSGAVDNELERRVTDELALQAAGATAVLNHVVVRDSERGRAALPIDPLLAAPAAVGVFHRGSTRQDIPGQGMHASTVFAVALARCQQQERCGFIGPAQRYESTESCIEELLSRERDHLERFASSTERSRPRLEECLLAVRTLDCASPFSAYVELPECEPDRICNAEP